MLNNSSDIGLSVNDSYSRKRDRKFLCWNGLLWSLGNTFVSTTLLIYIFYGLVDKSEFRWVFFTSAILTALPKMVGLFQIFAPKFLDNQSVMSRKAALFYSLSGLALCFVPLTILYQSIIPLYGLVIVLIFLWTVHHLSEYIGNIAVDCMVGELIPENHRG